MLECIWRSREHRLEAFDTSRKIRHQCAPTFLSRLFSPDHRRFSPESYRFSPEFKSAKSANICLGGIFGDYDSSFCGFYPLTMNSFLEPKRLQLITFQQIVQGKVKGERHLVEEPQLWMKSAHTLRL